MSNEALNKLIKSGLEHRQASAIVGDSATSGLAFVPEVRSVSADSDGVVTLPADGSWVDIPCTNVYGPVPDGVEFDGDEVSIIGDSLLTALYVSLTDVSGAYSLRAGFTGAEDNYINYASESGDVGTVVHRSRGATSSVENYIPLPHRAGQLLFQLRSDSAAEETVDFAEFGFERLLVLP